MSCDYFTTAFHHHLTNPPEDRRIPPDKHLPPVTMPTVASMPTQRTPHLANPIAQLANDHSLDQSQVNDETVPLTHSGIPQQIGGFTLGDKIGEGGMGVVYHATGPHGEPAALKLLKPDTVGDKGSHRAVFTRGAYRIPGTAPACAPSLSRRPRGHVLLHGDRVRWFA